MYFLYCVFFFFKQKTAYEMRISDWSSDVCSSDLHVERVGDAARYQIVGKLLGDLDGDINLRLAGRSAKMRSGDEIGRAEKRAFLGRLRHEHVQRRTGHMAIVERLLQGRFVNQAATRAVDDADALLGLGEILPAQNVARLLSKRRVQRDEVSAGEQFVQSRLDRKSTRLNSSH